MYLSRSLQHGWRRLRTAPVFTAFSVITLALGIGTTTAVYSLIFKQRRVVGESERSPVTMTVIGVSADTDARDVGRRASGVAYLPLDQHYEPRLVLAARVNTDPAAFVGQLRAAVASVDPDLVLVQIGTGLALAARTRPLRASSARPRVCLA